MSCFIGYSDSIMIETDQLKRRLSSEKIKASCVSLDREHETVMIQGSASEPYRASLSDCTCPDFSNTHQPCKHMYRLALELGRIEPLPKVNRSEFNAVKGRLSAELASLREEVFAGHLPLDKYLEIANTFEKIIK
jgi:uncharacterized Zn finger protein